MKSADLNIRRSLASRGAFTLLEILVVVSLLTVIVYGLYAMFDRTQKALRMNTAQVDVLESGRAALDVLTRDIEQAVASNLPDTNRAAAHLWAHLDYRSPLIQSTVDPKVFRTNVLQSCFFLTFPTKGQWMADGFFVGSVVNSASGIPRITTNEVNQTGFGTLYRYLNPPPPLSSGIYRLSVTNVQLWTNNFERAKIGAYQGENATNIINPVFPLADGVVHFRVRPYDNNGILITNNVYIDNRFGVIPRVYNAVFRYEPVPGERSFYFFSNSLPAFLELELGIIDPTVLQRVKGMPAAAQRSYLTNQVGAVHLFHKLIPLRNTQP